MLSKTHKKSVRNPRRIAFLCSFFDKMPFPHFDPFFKMPITLAAVGITGIAFLVVQAMYCRTKKHAATSAVPLRTPDDSDEEKSDASPHSGGAGGASASTSPQHTMAVNETEMTAVL